MYIYICIYSPHYKPSNVHVMIMFIIIMFFFMPPADIILTSMIRQHSL